MIHIVDATMKLLDQQVPGAKNIGLLATSCTVESGIYQTRAAGRDWMIPDERAQRDEVMTGICQGIQAGDIETGRIKLRLAAQRLADDGIDVILLACSEIALVLKTGDIRNPAGEVVPLIESLRRAGPRGHRTRTGSDSRQAGPRAAGGEPAGGRPGSRTAR